MGSFATALYYRIPRGLSWIVTNGNIDGNLKAPARSQCPHCAHVLHAKDLVPLFSWLFSRGKCRYCGVKIPLSYPVIECVTLFLTIGIYISWTVKPASAPLYAVLPFMVAAIAIDWKYMILPNSLNALLFVFSVLFAVLFWGQEDFAPIVLVDRVIASVFLTGALFLSALIVGWAKKRSALGMGDLKFLPAAGLFIGLAALPSFCVLAGIFGIFTALFKFKNPENKRFPFGPALIASLYVHLFLTGIGFDYIWPYSFSG